MWVFDGETWTNEGGQPEQKESLEAQAARYEQYMPELQIQEIVSVPQRAKDVPPQFWLRPGT
ncbi:MAG TPA: hypothetical protein VF980_06970, partial [Thermoanaerobaculia bacterium]